MNTNKTINIFLPWPTSANHIYQNAVRKKGGKTYIGRMLSPVVKAYKSRVMNQIISLRLESFGNAICSIELHFHPPSKLNYDIDNFKKVIFDSITAKKKKGFIGIINNDNQFFIENSYKYIYDERIIGVVVKIRECEIKIVTDEYLEKLKNINVVI